MAIESDAILPFNTVLRKCPSNAPLSPFLAPVATPYRHYPRVGRTPLRGNIRTRITHVSRGAVPLR